MPVAGLLLTYHKPTELNFCHFQAPCPMSLELIWHPDLIAMQTTVKSLDSPNTAMKPSKGRRLVNTDDKLNLVKLVDLDQFKRIIGK